jgi:hypothetical protein
VGESADRTDRLTGTPLLLPACPDLLLIRWRISVITLCSFQATRTSLGVLWERSRPRGTGEEICSCPGSLLAPHTAGHDASLPTRRLVQRRISWKRSTLGDGTSAQRVAGPLGEIWETILQFGASATPPH